MPLPTAVIVRPIRKWRRGAVRWCDGIWIKEPRIMRIMLPRRVERRLLRKLVCFSVRRELKRKPVV